MIITKNWLHQYLDLSDISATELAKRLTDAGLEVESIERMSNASHLIIGQVIACEPHPDSDHLHVCQVNIGDSVEQIVCGAPNVAVGQKVIVARVGAKLPNVEIKASVIRGQKSNGMLCSLAELGVDPKRLLPEQMEGIEVLEDEAPVGHEDPLAYLGLDDYIFDIGLTPNRKDCMAAWSMALETAAILEKEISLPKLHIDAPMESASFKVKSETEKCIFYLGKAIHRVSVRPSPKWMRDRLMAMGIPSINNLVDISNYVMLETGQPLHFYDLAALPSKEIVVKDQQICTYKALDGKEYDIQSEDILLTSENKPIGIAGVIGGDDSKINENTKGIFIEAAIFDPICIRNTSRRLNLLSEASIRFQKGIEPLAPFKAIARALELLTIYADASEMEETVQCGKNPYVPVEIDINLERMNALLGTQFEYYEVFGVLNRLQLSPRMQKHGIRVSIPSYREDLRIEEDIVEEIIRFMGYDRLPSTLPTLASTLGCLDKRQALRRQLRTILTNLGYYEAQTYTLISERLKEDALLPFNNTVEVASCMSEEHKFIRESILPSLLDSMAYNQARSIKDAALFEISNVYAHDIVEERLAIACSGVLQQNKWQNYQVKADFYTLKGLIETILSSIGFDQKRVVIKPNQQDDNQLHPYQSALLYIGKDLVGVFGKLHPKIAKKYQLSDVFVAELKLDVLLNNQPSRIKFTPISKYPSITRDLALIVEETIPVEMIIQSIQKQGKLQKEQIIQDIEVFDVYTGEHVEVGKKSIALSIQFQSLTHTLKDSEIQEVYDRIIQGLYQDVKAVLRS
ncbi:MAG: phenylalanine--tRNA ligase subunit beta [Erysipelotrichaceae bacterium]|nr:phenylalanine--tRNA ligase subunit beta [Erysipelotrichaceae bacterium]